MMKAMLSQPMGGKTEEEIVATRERAIVALTERGYEVINTLFTDEWYSRDSMEQRGVVQIPLCFLAKSLENMSLCHVAYFCKGWEDARGCRIEHEAAKAYGVDIIYEDGAYIPQQPLDVDAAFEWLYGYKVDDDKRVYTNGTTFVPLFRVKQAFVDRCVPWTMRGQSMREPNWFTKWWWTIKRAWRKRK